METEIETCPYCNARLPSSTHSGHPRECPRCGERLPFGNAVADEGPGTGPTHASEPRRRGWTASVIVGLMVLMAAISLAVGLRTVQRRRAWDPKEPLSYLPADTNVIGSVRIGPIIQEPSGHQFLDNLRIGPLSLGLDRLEAWTGVDRGAIHSVVLGLATNDRLLPRFLLVVQTEKPFDEEQARRRLRDAEPVSRGRKTLYRFPLTDQGVRGTLWYAAKSIVVLGLSPEDFDTVPDQPAGGIDQFSANVRSALQNRIGEGAEAWIVGDSDHWDRSIAGAWIAQRLAQRKELLSALRTWAVWLHFDTRLVSVHGACAFADAADARKFKDYLETTATGDEAPVAIDQERWVVWSFRGSGEALGDRLRNAFSIFGPAAPPEPETTKP